MKIGLIGTFDVENFGDCLFPELYAHLLRQHLPQAKIALYSPHPVAAEILSFDTVHALPSSLSDLGQFDADALILIGGETIGIGHSSGTFNFPRETLSAYLRLWLAPTMAALDDQARPGFFAAHCVGATKMDAVTSQTVAEALWGSGRCSFRDEFSVSWIRSEGVSFQRDIDPMFLIDHLCSEAEWQTLADAHLPASLGRDGYITAQISVGYGGNDLDAWVAAVHQIARQADKPVVLVSICHFLQDGKVLALAAERLVALGVETYLLADLLNVKETAAIIGLSAGYCGSSLHGAVTAVAFGKPLAVLGHSMDGKHEGSLRAVGVRGAVTIRPEGLPDCFRATAAADRLAARDWAQRAARASFDALIQSLVTAAPIAAERRKRAEAAASALVVQEREAMAPFGAAEMKRRAFRLLQKWPWLAQTYRVWRARKKIQRL